jgi:hypothetical protein
MKNKALVVLALLFLVGASRLSAQGTSDSTLTPQEIKDRLDGISENLNTLNGDVAILKGLKASGYLQFRYEYNDTSKSAGASTTTASNNPNANNFYIRRGRIKFTFQPNQSSKYVIYFDASKNTITLKEAYAELNHHVNDNVFTLTAGQFNIPFGYEIEYSSSKRDFPERSLAENNLFKGERDRGLNLTWNAPKYLQVNVGVLNGYGIEDSRNTWFDPTKPKDFVGRVKAKLGKLDVGFSTYFGKTFAPGTPAVAAVPGSTTWYDANANRIIDSGETTTTAPKAAVAAKPGIEYDKNRVGFDAQLYLDILPIGGTGIRGEFYGARDKGLTEQGWYLWLSQNLGTKFGAALRYDYWDPNAEGINDAVGTYSAAFHYFFDANVRITAAYDIAQTLAGKSTFSKYENNVKRNRFTLQFQYTI